jgi:hypothetical protein
MELSARIANRDCGGAVVGGRIAFAEVICGNLVVKGADLLLDPSN